MCLSARCLFVLDYLRNAVVCFQPPNLLIRNVWVPVLHFCMTHTLQSALESGQEARTVQIDFNAAFDRVKNQGILYMFCSKGFGVCDFDIDTVSIKPITTRYGGWLSE